MTLAACTLELGSWCVTPAPVTSVLAIAISDSTEVKPSITVWDGRPVLCSKTNPGKLLESSEFSRTVLFNRTPLAPLAIPTISPWETTSKTLAIAELCKVFAAS